MINNFCILIIGILLISIHPTQITIKNKHFEVVYSLIYNIPIQANYTLTRREVNKGKDFSRLKFHSYHNITSKEYYKTKYDRGHLIPAEDMSYDTIAYFKTYSMLNVFPQNPLINRGIWKSAESLGRNLAKKHGCVKVSIVAIPSKRRLKHGSNIRVPSSLVKVITTCRGKELLNLKVIN